MDKSRYNKFLMPLVFGVHLLTLVKSYPLITLINQSLITIYYNDGRG